MVNNVCIRLVKLVLVVVLIVANCYLLLQVRNAVVIETIKAESSSDGESLIDFDDLSEDKLQSLIEENLIRLKRPKVDKGDEKRTVVLIVSDYRSGSSLLGEMFNQNNDVYFLFEPLKDFDLTKTKSFLQDLLTCNPPKWGIQRRNRQSGCEQESPVFKNKVSACLRKKNHFAECRKYPILAAKFIRIRSIEKLHEYGVLDHANVFVIHSVRDPRGTINSRLAYDKVFYNGKSVLRSDVTPDIVAEMGQALCERYYNDSIYGDTLKEKYLRINYEDMCEDPAKNIKQAYTHIGQKPPQRVFDWFSEHTNAASISAAEDKMGLNRDSKLTAVRWRQELGQEYICAIERGCRPLFDYMGYEFACESF